LRNDNPANSGRLAGELLKFSNEVTMQKLVTDIAVKSRLNRRLAEKGECLRKCSTGSPWWSELGDYYIAEINTDNVIQTNVDLETLARKEGAMKSDEAITAELR
jgi:hypothetical protein